MLNHIVIMGRLARDPELRHTQSGTPVASFRLAVDRDFKDKNTGERATDWIDCVAWRSTGEFVSKYFTKGRMAVVEGRLQMRECLCKGRKRSGGKLRMDLLTPTVGQVYRNQNGCDYECTAVYPGGRAAMRRIKDGWTLVAVGVRQHEDGAIEWDYSLAGCWT